MSPIDNCVKLNQHAGVKLSELIDDLKTRFGSDEATATLAVIGALRSQVLRPGHPTTSDFSVIPHPA